MNKLLLQIALVTLTFSNCYAQKSNLNKSALNEIKLESIELLDSIINLAEKNSINSQKVNWEEVKKEMFLIANKKAKNSKNSFIVAVKYMLSQLGDDHGILTYKGEQYQVQNDKFRKYNATTYTIDSAIQNRILKERNHPVKYKMLNGDVAYLEISTIAIPFTEEDMKTWTITIREKICELKKENPKGWIIDLRTNLGGNMYAMLSGLGELLPRNYEMGGDSKDGKFFDSKWKLKEGVFYYGETATAYGNIPQLLCNDKIQKYRIAVLTSRYTSSSGEAVAAALKGQDNTRLFGEQTEGKSSSTSWYPLPNNTWLSLATSYYMGEDKTVYEDGIIPDEMIIEKLNLDDLMNSKAIDSAIEWMNSDNDKK